MKERGGAVRLFIKGDFEAALVGWKPTSQGEGGLFNPRGFAAIRVVVQRFIDDELKKDLYDQPLIVESPGAVVVCQAGMKVGLVENYRFVGERILDVGVEYIARLNTEERWIDLLDSLGAWKWELPRGIAPGEGKSLEEIVIAAARTEALDEAGFTLDRVRIAGRVNVNFTFFPHAQYVIHGRIVGVKEQNPEDLEIIGKTHLFSGEELRRMVGTGEFDDGLGLAALAIAGFHF